MKKINILLFLLLVVVLPLKVKALSVSENNLTMEANGNKTVDLYAEVDSEITEINFSLVYTSYDAPAYFNIESGLRDEVNGIKHRIVFSVPVSGKIKLGTVRVSVVNNPKITAGTINIHTAKATTSSGETINLNSDIINVTINKPKQEEPVNNTVETDNKDEKTKTNLLEKIESEIVKIEIEENVYEYSVEIDENIEELDLKPIAKDEKYTVETSSQKISELKDNQIVITVKDGENTEEYKINVKVIEEKEEVKIDEAEFESSFKYKGKWTTLIIILIVSLLVGLFLIKKK